MSDSYNKDFGKYFSLQRSSVCAAVVVLRWTASVFSTRLSSVVRRICLSRPEQLSGYDASCLSKSQIAGDNVGGEEADVGELLR